MNYELAKQLKDAGFPQTHRELFEIGKGFIEYRNQNDWAYIPTLPELIDECTIKKDLGDFLLHLTFFGRKDKPMARWRAQKRDGVERNITGSTPEEAVAKLYLAINRKDA